MTLRLLLWALLDAVLPSPCPSCGGLRGPMPRQPLCGRCASVTNALPCWHPVPAPIAGCWTLGRYSGPLGALVRRGKYRPDPGAINALGHRMARAATHRMPQVDVVCPVPLPALRQMQRGFNQAELLARPVGRALGVPVAQLLTRTDGREQATRTARQRRSAAASAFRAPRGSPSRVMLVDDVVTTGSTAAACATELLGAGATRVYLLAGVHAGADTS